MDINDYKRLLPGYAKFLSTILHHRFNNKKLKKNELIKKQRTPGR
jgi:hypothetical protein